MTDSCLDEDSRSEEEEAQPNLYLGESELSLEGLQLSKTRDVLRNFTQQLYKEFMLKTGLNGNHRRRKTKTSPRVHVGSPYLCNTLQNNDLDSAFECIAFGRLDELFDLLLNSTELVNLQDATGSSLLHSAVDKGSTELVNLLLSRGADVNLANHAGNRPIHLAFKGCRKSVIELLLSHGADYTCKNTDGVQPIHLAAEMNFVDGLKLLLAQSDVDVEAEDERGSSPIHYCCTVDSSECLQTLLDHGANIYHRNAFGDSSIHVAMFQSATNCARLLFEYETSRPYRDSSMAPTTTVGSRLLVTSPAPKGTGLLARLTSKEKRTSSCSTLSITSCGSDFDPQLLINLTDCEGFSPLHMAVSSGNLELVKICLLQRADLLAKDLTGQIPLHFACARGDLDCVQLLTEFRPRLKPRMIREPNNDGRTPMHVAAMHNSTEVIDYLVSQGAELNPVDQKRLTPLLLACSKGAIKSCTHLMGLGADLTACDEFGRNMLIMLLLSGAGKARELVPALTKSGKFPLLLNQPDKWGCTYMHVAARLGLRVAIKHGLTNQGSLLIRDSERSTPLHSAARFGRLNICAQMLEVDEGKRAQFLVDQLGRFPVHLAAQYGHNRVLELFQSKGCIQRRCRQGNTTLHYAAMSGNPATCALILGINPSLLNETNHNGSTALHFAAMYKNTEVIEYLLTAGAKILPDHNGTYFTTLSLQSKNYRASKVIAMHTRFPEIMETLRNTEQCLLELIVRHQPRLCLLLMDKCVKEVDLENGTVSGLMVQLKREELLIHPLCSAYLQVKWNIYGKWVHLLKTLFHLTLSIGITYFTLQQMPLAVNYEEPETKFCIDAIYTNRARSPSNKAILTLILIAIAIHMCVKGMQIFYQKWQYFVDWGNCFLLAFYLLMEANALINLFGPHGPHGVAISVVVMFISWFNLLLQLTHFHFVGIFVIMFIQVATTLLRSATLLSTLYVAFAVTFHKLLTLPEEACFQEFEEATREHKNRLAYCFLGFEHLNQSADVLGSRAQMGLPIKVYDSIGWALFQTLMMMVGEYDHTQLIVEPYLDGMSATIYIPELTFPFFAAFVFLVPITLVNLLIGLAVGDIDQVRRSATQQLISQRVYWLDSLESRFPVWLYQRINVSQWVKKAVVSLPSRDPHKEEIIQDLCKLTQGMQRISRKLDWEIGRVDQVIKQIGISSYEIETDDGTYEKIDVILAQSQNKMASKTDLVRKYH